MDGPSAPRVGVAASPRSIKSAVRDWLSISYGMINILRLARCARLPLSGFAGLLHGKACHTILRSLRFLTNRVPLPPLFRGKNKTPRNTFFISSSTVSTGCCAPLKRGKGGGASHQRGIAFPRPQGGCMVFPRAKPGCEGFIQTGAFYQFIGAHLNPRAKGASNLSPLRTFGPAGRQPSRP